MCAADRIRELIPRAKTLPSGLLDQQRETIESTHYLNQCIRSGNT